VSGKESLLGPVARISYNLEALPKGQAIFNGFFTVFEGFDD